MRKVKDFVWKKGMDVSELVKQLGFSSFQGVEVKRASELIARMKRQGAKIFLTYTSNLMTAGMRGLFAQMIKFKLANLIVTTVGGIEEDIMKAYGEEFVIGSFYSDDYELHEKGLNRVGNMFISNESYMKFEDIINPMLKKIYEKKKRLSVRELIHELGLIISKEKPEDENSVLAQASKNNVPIFCPGITDGALGFHLYLFQQKHPDFIVDILWDFKEILLSTSQDEKKGLIALGGGIAKHHAILAGLLNGGFDYALYMTTDQPTAGSLSGATTQEAKSWGKIKDDADAVTVVGDASVFFPIAICDVFEKLSKEGFIEEKNKKEKSRDD